MSDRPASCSTRPAGWSSWSRSWPSRCQIFQAKLYVPHTDSSLFPLPAEPGALQGYDPTLAIVDELHVVTEPVWEAMSLAAGKRDRSLTLAICTPAADTDSVMWKLGSTAGTVPTRRSTSESSPPPPAATSTTRRRGRVANPALDDFLHVDAAAGHVAHLAGVVVPPVPPRPVGRPGGGSVAPGRRLGRCASTRAASRTGAGVVIGLHGVVLPGLHCAGRGDGRRRAPRRCRRLWEPPAGARRTGCRSPTSRRRSAMRAAGGGPRDRRRPLPVDPDPAGAGGRRAAGPGVPAVPATHDTGNDGTLRGRGERRRVAFR